MPCRAHNQIPPSDDIVPIQAYLQRNTNPTLADMILWSAALREPVVSVFKVIAEMSMEPVDCYSDTPLQSTRETSPQFALGIPPACSPEPCSWSPSLRSPTTAISSPTVSLQLRPTPEEILPPASGDTDDGQRHAHGVPSNHKARSGTPKMPLLNQEEASSLIIAGWQRSPSPPEFGHGRSISLQALTKADAISQSYVVLPTCGTSRPGAARDELNFEKCSSDPSRKTGWPSKSPPYSIPRRALVAGHLQQKELQRASEDDLLLSRTQHSGHVSVEESSRKEMVEAAHLLLSLS